MPIFFQKSNLPHVSSQASNSSANVKTVDNDEVIDVSPAKHARKDVQSQAKYKISPEDDTFQVNKQLTTCNQIIEDIPKHKGIPPKYYMHIRGGMSQ